MINFKKQVIKVIRKTNLNCLRKKFYELQKKIPNSYFLISLKKKIVMKILKINKILVIYL